MTFEQMAYAKEIYRSAFATLRFSPDDFSVAKQHLISKGVCEDEAESVLATLSDCLDCAREQGMRPSPVDIERKVEKLNQALVHPRIICPLHGIRTLGAWQRELSDLLGTRGWQCRLNRWSFGKFPTIFFIFPPTREAKILWLRSQYDAEVNDAQLDISQSQPPSVIAHSFGTYILGYTLLRYDFIRFNKVILCGSILPRDFPWDLVIARGQVQAVRNEYGVRDPWVKRVRGYVRGTGASGALGFTRTHERLIQEEFDYDHGEYFGRDHMLDRWVPFLEQSLPMIPRSVGERIRRPKATVPCGTYLGLLSIIMCLGLVLLFWRSWVGFDVWAILFSGTCLGIIFMVNILVFNFYSNAKA